MAEAYMDHRKAKSDSAERSRNRELILSAIEVMREDIISEVITLRINELKGQVEGFEFTYRAYDPDPGNAVEENRLVRLIDDASGVLGELGVLVDNVRFDPEAGLQAWPPYLSLAYLRAQAMTEREVTYGATEIDDILPPFELALQRMRGLRQYLRDVSDGRFAPVTCRPVPDFEMARMCGYNFEQHWYICGRQSRPDAIHRCNELRQQHMDQAYSKYEGVEEVHTAIADLEEAIDGLDQDWFFGNIAILDSDIAEALTHMDDGRIAFRRSPPAYFERIRRRESVGER